MTIVSYWDCRPGCFVNNETGESVENSFYGNVFEWYSTLPIIILKYAKCKITISPEIKTILEHTVLWRFRFLDEPKERSFVGTLAHIEVYVDPYYPTNLIKLDDSESHISVKGLYL